MKVEFNEWESDDELLQMIEFEPEYFRSHVSTEVKEKAKDRGLVFFDKEDWKIVLTDDPDRYKEPLEAFGLEEYLEMRVRGCL